MISQIKDCVYEFIKLGQVRHELYAVLMPCINTTNSLIDAAKLSDKSVFSQISTMIQRMSSQVSSTQDVQMQKQLSKKDLQIKKLQEQVQMQKINQQKLKKASTLPPQKKPDPKQANQQSKAPNSAANNSKTVSAPQTAQSLEEKPLSVEERDNLIRQINSLTPV